MMLPFFPLLFFPGGVVLPSERAPVSGPVLWGPRLMLHRPVSFKASVLQPTAYVSGAQRWLGHSRPHAAEATLNTGFLGRLFIFLSLPSGLTFLHV